MQKFQATPFRSQLISNPPITISVEELSVLDDELKTLQSRAEVTRDRASSEIVSAEAILRKIKEIERERKGKIREKESKHAQERTRTPDADDDVALSILQRNGHASKPKQ